MTEQQMFDDLKQFIDARFLQQDEEFDRKLDEKLEEKLDEKLEEKLAPIKQQIEDLTNFVTDTFDTINEQTGHQLTNHEARITKLEQAH